MHVRALCILRVRVCVCGAALDHLRYQKALQGEPRLSPAVALFLLSHALSIFTHPPIIKVLAQVLVEPTPKVYTALMDEFSQDMSEVRIAIHADPAPPLPPPSLTKSKAAKDKDSTASPAPNAPAIAAAPAATATATAAAPNTSTGAAAAASGAASAAAGPAQAPAQAQATPAPGLAAPVQVEPLSASPDAIAAVVGATRLAETHSGESSSTTTSSMTHSRSSSTASNGRTRMGPPAGPDGRTSLSTSGPFVCTPRPLHLTDDTLARLAILSGKPLDRSSNQDALMCVAMGSDNAWVPRPDRCRECLWALMQMRGAWSWRRGAAIVILATAP